METVLAVAGGFVGVAMGAGGGYFSGKAVSMRPPWAYWVGNVLLVALGVGLVYVGLSQGFTWLVIGAVGLEAAGLTGLKYGYRGLVPRD